MLMIINWILCCADHGDGLYRFIKKYNDPCLASCMLLHIVATKGSQRVIACLHKVHNVKPIFQLVMGSSFPQQSFGHSDPKTVKKKCMLLHIFVSRGVKKVACHVDGFKSLKVQLVIVSSFPQKIGLHPCFNLQISSVHFGVALDITIPKH